MDTLLRDLRHGFRLLLKHPAFSLAAVLSLGLGIGANAAIFSVVDAVLLRPLPFANAGRLVMAHEAMPKMGAAKMPFSAPDYTAFSRQVRLFERVAAYQNRTYELSGSGQPVRIIGVRATAGLFPLLGVAPALGRIYSQGEETVRAKVAVLSNGLWRRQFGGNPGAIGHTVYLDRTPYTIVGVMPAGFDFPLRGPVHNDDPGDVFVPMAFTDHELDGFGMMYNNSVLARLAPDATLRQAGAEAQVVIRGFQEHYPAYLRNLPSFELGVVIVPFQNEVVGEVQRLLLILLAAVGVVLLIACADVASLLLTRAVVRQREMAVRGALGAPRRRLVTQVLTETCAIALSGGVAGLVIAQWATDALVSLAPVSIPRTGEIGIDGRVLVFTFVLCLMTAVLSGVAPALGTSGKDVVEILKGGGPTGTGRKRPGRVLGALVAIQFALAVTLLIGAALLARSFFRLVSTDPGFRPEHALSLSTSLPGAAYTRGDQIRSFYRGLLQRARTVPGVQAAAIASDLPLSAHERRAFSPEPAYVREDGPPQVVSCTRILGDYFTVLGIPLKRGRYLTDRDGESGTGVVVINETMARMFWPGLDPVGRRMKWGVVTSSTPWFDIVGVVADVKNGPLHAETIPQVYEPYLQVPDGELAETVTGWLRALDLLVRSDREPLALVTPLRNAIREVDVALPVTAVQTMDQLISASVAPQRFNTYLLIVFAAVALLLAAVGICGVLAYSVSQRRKEIGIRLALGASRRDVLKMVVRQGLVLAAAGIAAGMVVAWQLTRAIGSLLYDVSPRDPWTFVAVPLLLMLVAAGSIYFPARRATRVDPLLTLRQQ